MIHNTLSPFIRRKDFSTAPQIDHENLKLLRGNNNINYFKQTEHLNHVR